MFCRETISHFNVFNLQRGAFRGAFIFITLLNVDTTIQTRLSSVISCIYCRIVDDVNRSKKNLNRLNGSKQFNINFELMKPLNFLVNIYYDTRDLIESYDRELMTQIDDPRLIRRAPRYVRQLIGFFSITMEVNEVISNVSEFVTSTAIERSFFCNA